MQCRYAMPNTLVGKYPNFSEFSVEIGELHGARQVSLEQKFLFSPSVPVLSRLSRPTCQSRPLSSCKSINHHHNLITSHTVRTQYTDTTTEAALSPCPRPTAMAGETVWRLISTTAGSWAQDRKTRRKSSHFLLWLFFIHSSHM